MNTWKTCEHLASKAAGNKDAEHPSGSGSLTWAPFVSVPMPSRWALCLFSLPVFQEQHLSLWLRFFGGIFWVLWDQRWPIICTFHTLMLSLFSTSHEFLICPLKINIILHRPRVSPVFLLPTHWPPTTIHIYWRDVAVATSCEEALELFYYYILKTIIAEGVIFKIEEV